MSVGHLSEVSSLFVKNEKYQNEKYQKYLSYGHC
jgi:hypothetical protein